MSTPSITKSLAQAIQSCTPGDPEGVSNVKAALTAAVQACASGGPEAAEALLSCLLNSFVEAGDRGKAVLDDMVLEILPTVASLAQDSAACSRSLSDFCSLVAAACSPRDTITAFLEVLDNLMEDSPGPDSLQFACNLLLMLPEQVGRLSRRKVANAVECCNAAASLAQVHGQVLAGWTLNQMSLAAQQAAQEAPHSSKGLNQDATGTLSRLDTFLAANWQAYVEFAEGIMQQAVKGEADAKAQRTARQGVTNLILQLLQYLTALWVPHALHGPALQLLGDPGSAQLMPSTESVAPPRAMLAAQSRQQRSNSNSDASNAEEAVLDLLKVLHACQVTTCQQLPTEGHGTAAGAGLAVLYSCCICQEGHQALVVPADPVEALQVASQGCCAIVEASDNNALAILKAIALLQLTSAHVKQLQDSSNTGLKDLTPLTDAGQAMVAASSSVQGFMAVLQPCINILAGVMSQVPVQALRSQAAVALHQLLQALPQQTCFACLQQLLAGRAGADGDESVAGAGAAVHPEVAALVMQEVRSVLAAAAPGSCFTPVSCTQLVLPWLQQHGPVGWQTAEALPDLANAVCAALAVVRLALLRNTPAADTSSNLGVDLRQQLQLALTPLTAAVGEALKVLQTVNSHEQGATAVQAVAGGVVRVPGEAQGSGQAVDAWLAVSRVQDVLDRVLELL